MRVGEVGIRDSSSAARVINGDGVHVLVSLDGWNLKNRNNILFHRPCAIQVSALGHLTYADVC
jgi:predicted O-linked N-acetylglucosamine transferase (SPINDLY family)